MFANFRLKIRLFLSLRHENSYLINSYFGIPRNKPYGETNFHQTAYLRKGYLWTKKPERNRAPFSFLATCPMLDISGLLGRS